MADKCRNEGCGAYFVVVPTGCMFKEDYQVTSCVNFTRTPTQSITVEELDKLRIRSTRAIISNATYNSAVLGRKEFRKLYREAKAENKRLAAEVERLKASNEKVSDEVNSRLLGSKEVADG